MRRFHRAAMLAALLALAPVLTACENFDPDKLDVLGLNKKKPLPGDRKPLFPEGVPGVTQGIPPEYMKGNTAEQPGAAIAVATPPAEQQPKAKAKPKPKPREAARKPTQVTVQPPAAARPAAAARQAAPPPWPAQQQPAQQQPQQPQQAQSPWPTPAQGAPAPWPSAPPPGTFSKQ